MSPLNLRAWSRLLSITKPFFTSEQRWWAWGGLGLLLAFIVSLNLLNVVKSYVGRDFMTAIAEREPERYSFLALVTVGVFVVLTIVDVFYQFTQRRLALRWRRWLTHHLVE